MIMEKLVTQPRLDELSGGKTFERCEVIFDVDEGKRNMTTLRIDLGMEGREIRVFMYDVYHRDGEFIGVHCNGYDEITPQDEDWGRFNEFYNRFSGGIN